LLTLRGFFDLTCAVADDLSGGSMANLLASKSFPTVAISLRTLAALCAALFIMVVIFAPPAAASTAVDFSVVISFGGSDGSAPVAPLIQGMDGSISRQ
jgi:hypothetical protein